MLKEFRKGFWKHNGGPGHGVALMAAIVLVFVMGVLLFAPVYPMDRNPDSIKKAPKSEPQK